MNSTKNSLKAIENKLSEVSPLIKESLQLSLEEINKNSQIEKQVIEFWMDYISSLSDYLFMECERTGNKDIYKRFTRYMIFKH